LLVLWDVDYTLVDSGGTGRDLYEIAFREMFGGDMPQPGSMSGRTDRAIALEVLTLAGVPDPRRQVAAFHALMAARAPALAGIAREQVRELPGAARAVAALRDGRADPEIIQSLLTGNIRPLAEMKVGVLGLAEHLDFDVGAYGDVHEERAELVHVARRNAARGYGGDFDGEATVLVGDTPLDVGAALDTGARAVGVATGGFSEADLASSGAHAVLPDLTDTDRVLAAILGRDGVVR
jgi:phosphoglycolate phosphatase